MRRITVDLEDELYRRLKIYCAEHDIEIAALVRQLLADTFQKASGKKQKK
jgi:plasmid stability protein